MSNVQISDLPLGTVDLTDIIHINEGGLDRSVTIQAVYDLILGTVDHQDLDGSGLNTHAQIDSHINDTSIHRSINDAVTTSTNLWSASKIQTQIDAVEIPTSQVISGTFSDARISQSSVTQHQAAINHDALLNFVANEHIDHSAVNVVAGVGLSGGGAINTNVTLDLDVTELTEKVTPDAADVIPIYDVAGAAHKKITVSSIAGAAYIPTGANVGVGGVGVYKEVSGSELRFRNINAGDSSITVTLDDANNEIDISVNAASLDAASLGGVVAANYARTDILETFNAGIAVTGNIGVTGTVDGRDVAADGTKLDGIAVNANNYVHPNHTGDVISTGDGATLLDTAAISGKTELTTGVAGTDELLINDSGALKRMDISVLAELLLYRTGAGNKSVTGVPYIPETTLTDGATITWNFATANVEAVVTLGGNRTLAMSNIPPAGTWATLRVVQGSSTARTLAFGTGIDAGDQGTPTLSSGAGKEDILNFRSNGTVMQFLGKVGGFA